MSKDRSIHELLIILKDNVRVTKSYYGLKQRIYRGLCYEIGECQHLFSDGEIYELIKYITLNKPAYINTSGYIWGYGWRPSLWRPRLRWLNKHIKLTKPKQ